MNKLLEFTLQRHGGLENWNRFKYISAHVKVDGPIFGESFLHDLLNDIHTRVEIGTPNLSFVSYTGGWETSFNPQHVRAAISNGELIEELRNPLQTFRKPQNETPWSRLQTFYLGGDAIWGYLNMPFCFAHGAYRTDEIKPFIANGELFRRLRIVSPAHRLTHSHTQLLYIDDTGLIRRHDYDVNLAAISSYGLYLTDYIEVRGLKFPTTRHAFRRRKNDPPTVSQPIIGSINISELLLS